MKYPGEILRTGDIIIVLYPSADYGINIAIGTHKIITSLIHQETK